MHFLYKRRSKTEKRIYREIAGFIKNHPHAATIEDIATGTGLDINSIADMLKGNQKYARFFEPPAPAETVPEPDADIPADEEEILAEDYFASGETEEYPEDDVFRKAENDYLESVLPTPKEFDPADAANCETITNFKGFVMDTSMIGTANFQESLKKIIQAEYKIILPDIVVRELNAIQAYDSKTANTARYILKLAAMNEDVFICENAEKTNDIPDEVIIDYCAGNKNSVVLITGDKMMTLLARAKGVKTVFFVTTGPFDITGSFTLHNVKGINGKFYFQPYIGINRAVIIVSGGETLPINELSELKYKDDVYIISSSDKGTRFRHYRFDRPALKHNCTLVKQAYLSTYDEITALKNPEYIKIAEMFFGSNSRLPAY